MWTDTFAKVFQASTTFTPDAVPPEMLRQIRAGVLQALAQSWEEFMRSPQFMEGMKQMMDNAIAFRKLSSDFLTKARHEWQGTAREDIDSLMLALRHMEGRVLDRVEALSARVDEMNQRLDALDQRAPKPKPPKLAGPKPQGL
jgi:methyl-accepting chemotaxis protein